MFHGRKKPATNFTCVCETTTCYFCMCCFPQLSFASCGPEIMPIYAVYNVIGYIFAEV